MLTILPLGAFVLMWVLLYRASSQDRGVRISFLCACILWGALVVFNTESLSIIHVLNRGIISNFWIIVCLLAGFLLRKTSDPDLSRPKAKHTSKTDDTLNFFIILIITLVGITAFVAPPNNWDSMTYHMSRVAHWIQNRSVEFFPTSMPRQLWASPWAEYAIAQLQILTQSDRLANMVQWWSMTASVIGVSLIAKILGAGRRGQILSALAAATLPVGILEASSTQNDYAVAFWLVCITVFELKLIKELKLRSAVFLGLSLGLAVLTKGTALTFAAPMTAWALITGFKKYGLKFWPAVGITLGLFLLITSPQFIRNYQLGGHILSPVLESKNLNNTDYSFEGTVSTAIQIGRASCRERVCQYV